MINNEQNTPVSQSLLSICAPDPSGGRGEDFVLSGQERERRERGEREIVCRTGTFKIYFVTIWSYININN